MLEKRAHMRVPTAIPVLCEPTENAPFGGTATDISPGGACIAGSTVPPFGATLVVDVRLPGSPDLSRLPAVVRWAGQQLFGVQFGLIGDHDARHIADLTAAAVGAN